MNGAHPTARPGMQQAQGGRRQLRPEPGRSTRRTADREGSTRSGVPGGSERTVAPHITRRLKHGVPTVRVSQSLPTLPYPSPRQLSAARSWRHPSAPRDFRRAHGVICARDKDNFRRKYLSEVGNYCDCSLVPVGHCFVLFSPIFVDFISLPPPPLLF